MVSQKNLRKTKPRNLLKEARFLLRKKGRRLGENERTEIEEAISSLELKSASGSADDIQQAKEVLYGLISKYMPKTVIDVLKDLFRSLVTAIIIALVFRQFVMEPFEIPTGSMIPTLKIGDKILVSKFTYGLNIPFTCIKILDFNKPKRWEVVVFTTRNIKDSSDIQRNFVKRVVGLPGETIGIENGEIYRFDTAADGSETKTHIAKPDYLQELENDYCYYRNVDKGKTSSVELFETRKWLGFIPVKVPNGSIRIVNWKYGFHGQKINIPPGHYFVLGDNNRDSFDSRGWGFVPFENIRGRVICKWKFMPPWGNGFVR